MRRLIFGWFLASLALLLGIILLGLAWSGPTIARTMMRYFGKGLIGYAAEGAVAAYEQGGVEGLDRFASRSHPSALSRTALVDEKGAVLTTGARPGRLMERAAKVSRAGEMVAEARREGAVFVASAAGSSGRRYTLVVEIPSGELLWNSIDLPSWMVRVGLTLVTAVVVCSWLATKLIVPLEDLRTQTRKFAAGELGVRSTVGLAQGVPEIAGLAADFDHMAERIEALVRSQRQLLHFVSHELRTPLTRLQLAIGMAEREATPEILKRIEREGERLNELLSQILNYSKLEAATGLEARQPIDWRDFLESVVGDASFEAGAVGKQVRIGRCDGGRFAGDRELLRSALENVIRNGIRHSPEGGEVVVEQRGVAGGGWEIWIEDQGPGVGAGELTRIFEPFYRAAGSGAGTGHGLGLAIAQRVAQLHGGRVWAEAPGGLRVKFEFPALVG